MDKLFEVHVLNAEGMQKAEGIAHAFNALFDFLTTVCPEGRELSVCKTKLEEASFFAKKAMACAEQNQLKGETK